MEGRDMDDRDTGKTGDIYSLAVNREWKTWLYVPRWSIDRPGVVFASRMFVCLFVMTFITTAIYEKTSPWNVQRRWTTAVGSRHVAAPCNVRKLMFAVRGTTCLLRCSSSQLRRVHVHGWQSVYVLDSSRNLCSQNYQKPKCWVDIFCVFTTFVFSSKLRVCGNNKQYKEMKT